MTTKTDLHRLVDELPESEVPAAKRNLGDPMTQALMEAPCDDEPTTPEEDAAAEEAWQEYLRGEALSSEEANRELLS
jgi:hypothetical protein